MLSCDLCCSSSSTNLTELAKAVRLLASLSPSTPTGDELLKAARALAAATAGLLNSAQPENMEVRIAGLYTEILAWGEGRGRTILCHPSPPPLSLLPEHTIII